MAGDKKGLRGVQDDTAVCSSREEATEVGLRRGFEVGVGSAGRYCNLGWQFRSAGSFRLAGNSQLVGNFKLAGDY